MGKSKAKNFNSANLIL